MRAIVTLLLCAIAILTLAACNGGGAGGTTPEPSETAGETPAAPTEEPSASPEPVSCQPNLERQVEGAVTWGIAPEPRPAPEGWEVVDDIGQGPFLNVLRDGESVGSVELLQFPHEADFDPQQGVAALEAWADTFYDSISGDRAAGLGDSFEFERDPVVPVAFGSFCGISYGYTVRDVTTGDTIERYIGHATFDPGTLYLFVAVYDVTYAGEIGWRDPESLEAFAPYLGQLAESLTFPPG